MAKNQYETKEYQDKVNKKNVPLYERRASTQFTHKDVKLNSYTPVKYGYSVETQGKGLISSKNDKTIFINEKNEVNDYVESKNLKKYKETSKEIRYIDDKGNKYFISKNKELESDIVEADDKNLPKVYLVEYNKSGFLSRNFGQNYKEFKSEQEQKNFIEKQKLIRTTEKGKDKNGNFDIYKDNKNVYKYKIYQKPITESTNGEY